MQSSGSDPSKQQDLGSLERVQLKIYNSDDHDFLWAKTRLDMKQL
jgi:hypothetical protein